ncbi:hypothetical protein [Pseudomonas frederiksbergensis]|uniref:hypothetical protein n=1 Tax=Pseudomonas frederiksbergensis TaxID=104087 RepID=UPI0011CD4784|nr:hypothetical protein [Pseudomonas frederiksbergensis]
MKLRSPPLSIAEIDMATKKPSKLTFELSEEQMKSLQPLIDQTGSVDIVATIKEGKLAISYLACQAAFTSELRLDKKNSAP